MWQFVVWCGHLHIDSLNIIIQHAHFAYIKRTRPENDAMLWELAIICFLNRGFSSLSDYFRSNKIVVRRLICLS